MRDLLADMKRFGLCLCPPERARLAEHVTHFTVSAGAVLFDQAKIADRIAFLGDGLAASRQTWSDGRVTITRFFETGDFCTNVSSAWTGELACDDLIAITDLRGMCLPLSFFESEYLEGGTFGTYLRYRMLEAHLFAKELASAKTANDTEIVYQFLDTHHASVLDRAPKKDIAGFLGVTPQGFSRFLRRRGDRPAAMAEIPRRQLRQLSEDTDTAEGARLS